MFISFEYVLTTYVAAFLHQLNADHRPGSMAAGCWSVPHVVGLINRYHASPAQTTVDGKALVSTFEGSDWAHNWLHVRNETAAICLVPNWSSLGPHGVAQKLDLIDGACKSIASVPSPC
jgi:hypothetical protein